MDTFFFIVDLSALRRYTINTHLRSISWEFFKLQLHIVQRVGQFFREYSLTASIIAGDRTWVKCYFVNIQEIVQCKNVHVGFRYVYLCL